MLRVATAAVGVFLAKMSPFVESKDNRTTAEEEPPRHTVPAHAHMPVSLPCLTLTISSSAVIARTKECPRCSSLSRIRIKWHGNAPRPASQLTRHVCPINKIRRTMQRSRAYCHRRRTLLGDRYTLLDSGSTFGQRPSHNCPTIVEQTVLVKQRCVLADEPVN